MQSIRLEVADQAVVGEISLGDKHPGPLRRIGVFVGDSTPASLNCCKSRLIPHRTIPDELAEFFVFGEIWKTGFLNQRVGDVDAETVNPAVEPEPQHAVKLFEDVGVLPVPVGLGNVEKVQVPLTRSAVRLGDALPCAAAEN